jgi:3-hydroxyisobutyrate dehydrogenase-like beta-hydroxyacid dehydrogenase
MRVGFIGLGNIGRDIAWDLAVPGNELTIYDVVPAAAVEFGKSGARVAGSPAEVAEASDLVGICVQDDQQVLDVMNGTKGILAVARPGLLVLIHSTIRVKTVRSLAERAAKQGVRVLDVPVTRPPKAPPSKGIVFIVGGSPEDVRAVRPYVSLCALKSVETGPLGTAMTLKICNNMLTYLQLCGAEDVMQLAEAAGLDLQHLVAVTSTNGVGSPSLLAAFERRGKPASQSLSFEVPPLERLGGISEKDLDCALDTGRDLGVKLPSAEMSRQNIRKAFAAWFKGG